MISEAALTCPFCGFPLSKINTTLHLKWDDGKLTTWLKATILVDGTEISTMKCGDSVDCDILYGTHRIEVYSRNIRVIDEQIEIPLGSNDFDFTFKKKRTSVSLHVVKSAVSLPEPAQMPKSVLDQSDAKGKQKKRYIPRCPTCGSDKIKKIPMERRVLGAYMIGIASKSAGKTFKCKNCGYRW